MKRKSAPVVTKALNEIFAKYSDVKTYFKTITSESMHPWKRVYNERHNGLIPRFIKKVQNVLINKLIVLQDGRTHFQGKYLVIRARAKHLRNLRN